MPPHPNPLPGGERGAGIVLMFATRHTKSLELKRLRGGEGVLETLLGSTSCEQVLLFLLARDEGYPREIARFFCVDYRPIRNQLTKLEQGGILRSRPVGRTRLYSFNPRCPYLPELRGLLEKVMTFCPDDLKERLLMNRRRPRAKENRYPEIRDRPARHPSEPRRGVHPVAPHNSTKNPGATPHPRRPYGVTGPKFVISVGNGPRTRVTARDGRAANERSRSWSMLPRS